MATTHILIFEPEATGHQMNFIRYLLDGIRAGTDNPRVTVLTTAEAAAHPNCVKLHADYADLVTIRVTQAVTESNRVFRALGVFYERQWQNAETFTRGLAELGPETVDVVLLPHLEAIGLLHLALHRRLFHGLPWAPIAHAIRFHHRRLGIGGPFRSIDILQRIFFWRVVRSPGLICFGTNNVYLPDAVRHPKVVYCPTPVAARPTASLEAARAAYGIRPETCLILVFGFLDRRKCLDILFEGVARVIPDLDVTVMLAGRQHAGHLAPILDSAAARKLREHGRLVEVNRFLIEGEDIDPMNAADILWVFYERNFVTNSSVLVESALARKPVIARDQGLVGRQVKDHNLGLALSSDTPEAIAAAVTRLATDPALRHAMGENGPGAFAGNTPENFSRPIVEAIRRIRKAA